MHTLKLTLSTLLLLLLLCGSVYAADTPHYYVGDGGTNLWSGDCWSSDNDGVVNAGFGVPDDDDTVYFNASSGNCAISNANAACGALTLTGYTGTITVSSPREFKVQGTFTGAAGATITNNQDFTMAVGTKNFTSNGMTINGTGRMNFYSGNWTLADDLTISCNLSTGPSATFNISSRTVSANNISIYSTSTLTSTGSTINCTGDSFEGTGHTFNTVNFNGTGYSCSLSGANTFGAVTVNKNGKSLTNSTDTQTCSSFTITDGTYAGTAAMNCSGNVTVAASKVWSNTGTLTLSGNSSILATGGVSIGSPVVFTGTGPSITGAGTFSSITLNSSSAQTLTLPASATTTFTGEGIRVGSGAQGRKTVQSSAASATTLSKNGGYLLVDLAGGTASWLTVYPQIQSLLTRGPDYLTIDFADVPCSYYYGGAIAISTHEHNWRAALVHEISHAVDQWVHHDQQAPWLSEVIACHTQGAMGYPQGCSVQYDPASLTGPLLEDYTCYVLFGVWLERQSPGAVKRSHAGGGGGVDGEMEKGGEVICPAKQSLMVLPPFSVSSVSPS